MEEKEKAVKETFISKSKGERIKVSNEFYKELFFHTVDGNIVLKEPMPIEALRIVVNIFDLLRNRQFQYNVEKPSESVQLDLFKKTYLYESEAYAKIVLKNSDISNTGNIESIKRALQFLVNFKQEWHIVNFINEKGETEKKQFFGGLIIEPSLYKGTTTFYINPFWFKKIVAMVNYNYVLYSLVYSMKSNKQFLFALWINTLKESGTKATLEHMNTTWGLKYKDLRSLKKGFLDPIRKVLDRVSSYSFNSSIKGNFIGISRYELKSINTEEIPIAISSDTKQNQFRIYKLSYLKKRHKLTDKQIKALELVFDKDISAKYTFSNAYTNVVKRYNSARRRDKSYPLVTDIPFNKLINEIQEEVITIYKESKANKLVPNGYPVFNSSL